MPLPRELTTPPVTKMNLLTGQIRSRSNEAKFEALFDVFRGGCVTACLYRREWIPTAIPISGSGGSWGRLRTSSNRVSGLKFSRVNNHPVRDSILGNLARRCQTPQSLIRRVSNIRSIGSLLHSIIRRWRLFELEPNPFDPVNSAAPVLRLRIRNLYPEKSWINLLQKMSITSRNSRT